MTLEQEIAALGPWFHNLCLKGRQTAPDHFLDHPSAKWRTFRHLVPDDLSGMSVLDIGCNAGFFSLEMKRGGAAEIVGLDSDPRYLAQAALASTVSGLPLELRELSVYEVARLGRRFDLMLFLGVLYHLRQTPLLALDLLRTHVVGDRLLFQSLLDGDSRVAPVAEDYRIGEHPYADPGFPRLHFIERRYAGDPTNWWIPNRAGAEAMLRDAGFAILDHADPDVWLCRTDGAPPHPIPNGRPET